MKNKKSFKNIIPSFLINHLGLPEKKKLNQSSEKKSRFQSVGDLLCSERMRVNADLEEIATLLRIRYSYLVAIEDGRYDDLPGLVYSYGFIRAYADYLGLDGAAVIKQFRKEIELPLSAVSSSPIPDFDDLSSDEGLPTGSMLVLAVAMGTILYTGWFVLVVSNGQAVELIRAVPERMIALLGDNELALLDNQWFDPVASAGDGGSLEQNTGKELSRNGKNNVKDTIKKNDIMITTEKNSEGFLETISNKAQVPKVISSDSISEIVTVNNQVSERSSDKLKAVELELQVGPNSNLIIPKDKVALRQEVGSEVNDSESAEALIPLKVNLTPKQTDEAVLSSSNSTNDMKDEPRKSALLQKNKNEGAKIQNSPVKALATAINTKKPRPSGTVSPNSETKPEKVNGDAQELSSKIAEKKPNNNVDNIRNLIDPDPIDGDDTPEEKTSIQKISKDTVEIKARSDTWIQVRNGQELMLTKFLRSGSTYRVPAIKGLTLMAGNAGGLEVYIGGNFIRKLGKDGEVLKAVMLDVESLYANSQTND